MSSVPSAGSVPDLSEATSAAQAAHREAELRMRLALDAAAIGVWEFDATSARLSWDERVREVVELEAGVEPTWNEHFLASLHPDDRETVSAAFGRLLADGEGARLALECRVVGRRTGKITWSALEGRCLQSRPGALRVIGTARDITAERQAALDLQSANDELEQRVAQAVAERQIWADIIESSDDSVAAVDLDLRIIAMNKAYAAAFERLFQAPIHLGDSLLEALDHMPETRDVSAAIWRRALGGEVVEIPRSREAAPKGRVYDIKFRPLHDRQGRPVGAFQIARDVTQRVRATERLRDANLALQRAQKMEALGHLTGGVAHDFNNLLQVISGNLQLLKSDLEGDPRAERRLENALSGVARGSKLASQLLAFGRRQPLEPKVINLGRFLIGMEDMLRRALGEEIEIEVVVSGGLWNTLVDPGQIENAILNLAINARDAMDGRGRLTLEAGNVVLDEDYARQEADVTAGGYVMMAVTDTGCGIPADLLERVFEPFFSTKGEGRGAGLGLSMVHGLVKQTGGHVKVYSEVGEGTTVRLYLPRALQPEDVLPPVATTAVEGGTETVLVVEDDAEVRDTAVALLSDLGYTVLKASDASNALAVVESGVGLDLLFTDVVMPGPLRSPELARRAVEQRPDLAVLFTSGYAENAIVHGGRLDEGVELLSKPYTREALARKVRQVLAAKQDRMKAARRSDDPSSFSSASQASLGAGERTSAGVRGCRPDTRGEGLRVLLVEDDQTIRDSAATMLREAGFVVAEAGDAAAALALADAESFDVLVADRGLPGPTGEDVAHQVLARHPDVAVVFAAGQAAAVPEPGLANAVYLIKPYGLEDLQRSIAQALARPRRARESA